MPNSGARNYIAALGGFMGERTLRSVSGNLVKQGDLIECGSSTTLKTHSDLAIADEKEGPIEVIPGPQSNLFDLSMLESKNYEVSLQSNRVGILLEGDSLNSVGELPSEPACVGAIQVNNRGQLMILGPDGPTIGGYPKIAVVRECEMSRVAQLRPGVSVKFKLVGS